MGELETAWQHLVDPFSTQRPAIRGKLGISQEGHRAQSIEIAGGRRGAERTHRAAEARARHRGRGARRCGSRLHAQESAQHLGHAPAHQEACPAFLRGPTTREPDRTGHREVSRASTHCRGDAGHGQSGNGDPAARVHAPAEGRHDLRDPVIEPLREDNARQSFIEPDQLAALIATLPAPLRPVVQFAYFTGWRIRSEVLPLEWRQVDRPACVIRLEAGTTKNNKPRVFAYGAFPQLKALIDEQWAERERSQRGPSARSCSTGIGGQRIRDFADAWRVACKVAGLRGKDPARPAALSRPQSGAGWRVPAHGHDDDGPSDARGVPSLRHHQRGRKPTAARAASVFLTGTKRGQSTPQPP